MSRPDPNRLAARQKRINLTRAECARTALGLHGEIDARLLNQAITDLLADCLHLGDSVDAPVQLDSCLESADHLYAEEGARTDVVLLAERGLLTGGHSSSAAPPADPEQGR